MWRKDFLIYGSLCGFLPIFSTGFSSFIWGEWPSGFGCYNQNRKNPSSKPTTVLRDPTLLPVSAQYFDILIFILWKNKKFFKAFDLLLVFPQKNWTWFWVRPMLTQFLSKYGPKRAIFKSFTNFFQDNSIIT